MSRTHPSRLYRAARRAANRRGLAFCYTLIVMSAMLTLGLVFIHVGLNSAKWAYNHYQQQQALYLAESAVERAIWMMERSQAGEEGINAALEVTDEEAASGITRSFTSGTWDLASGSYSFVATAPYNSIPGTVAIRALGNARRGSQEGVFAIVRPDFNPDDGTADMLWADCFNYGMYSNHNLVVKGNPSVLCHSDQGGSGIYANGDIHFLGTAALIEGPIAATGSVYGTCTQNPADAGIFEGENCPEVAMPKCDMAFYEQKALSGGEVYNGNVSFTGGLDSFGTPENPKIIYVDGSVKLAGNFTGVGIIVATKGFKVTGNVKYGSPDAGWAFITPGKFTMTGTAQVHGCIFCHNGDGTAEFIGHGTPNVFGSIVADLITVTGDYTVEWDGNITGIHDLPGCKPKGGPPQVETLAWERD